MSDKKLKKKSKGVFKCKKKLLNPDKCKGDFDVNGRAIGENAGPFMSWTGVAFRKMIPYNKIARQVNPKESEDIWEFTKETWKISNDVGKKVTSSKRKALTRNFHYYLRKNFVYKDESLDNYNDKDGVENEDEDKGPFDDYNYLDKTHYETFVKEDWKMNSPTKDEVFANLQWPLVELHLLKSAINTRCVIEFQKGVLFTFSNTMASSSTSTVEYDYDVILSYLGSDIPTEFVDALSHTILDEGLYSLDDDATEMETTVEDGMQLFSYFIQRSRASIVILSKEFANSEYCFRKLQVIVDECETNKQHRVFLMYYDIKDKMEARIRDWIGLLAITAMNRMTCIDYSENARVHVENLWKEVRTKLPTTKYEMEGKYIERIFVGSDVIGEGERSTIYKGFYGSAEVAVKRVTYDADFVQETMILGRLSSPNVVRWYASEVDGGFGYIAFEYCHCNLYELAKKFPTLEVDESLDQPYPSLYSRLVKDVANGLHSIHEAKVLHRNLKPTNVLIIVNEGKTSATAKVAGFGSSRHYPDGSTLQIRRDMKKDMNKLGQLLSRLQNNPEAKNLSSELSGTCTISTKDALAHPVFWDAEKRLSFLTDVSNDYAGIYTQQPERTQINAHFKKK